MNNHTELSLPILKREIDVAVNTPKKRKSPGNDNIRRISIAGVKK